jgi:6-phosphogluconolactonase
MHTNWLRIISKLTLLASAGTQFTPLAPASAYANNMSYATPDHSNYILYVGTYGKGVYGYRYNAADASLQPLSLVGEVVNPSWLTTDPSQKYLYAASELSGDHKGAVVSFKIDHSTGKLTLINSRSSEGLAPCHVAVDATGKMLVTANYTSGNVASYPLGPDGKIGELASLMGAHGSGPNKKRQEGPHAHETVISANNRFLYVPDLGLDQIRVYKLDTDTGQLTTANTHPVEAPGSGPRHIVFSPDDKFAYVINELTPVVDVFSHDAGTGKLEAVQTISSAPPNRNEDDGPAEILISKNGKYVYASNRGPGTIAVYSVDAASGKLTLVQTAETGFTMPRGVEFDPAGNVLFVGDQKTNKFETFHVDTASGKLTPTGKSYDVPSPVAFLFVPAS